MRVALGLGMIWGALSIGGAESRINLLAAASLADALTEIAREYEKEHGEAIALNLGASSLLARQIEAGAPADVFFSADEAKLDGLEKGGMLVKRTRVSLLSNSLVIVVAAEDGVTITEPEGLAGDQVKRFALAEPKTVPAGIYAREFLERAGLWAKVQAKVVPTENVRAALAAVAGGNAEAGIVYKTDAAISKDVKVAYEVPARESPRISYGVAVVRDARNPQGAKRFIEYLQAAKAEAVFRKLGFVVLTK